MDPGSGHSERLEFERFVVVPHRRELLVDGHAVKLSGRAFDILMVLIESRGGVISKDALMARVWPDRLVEEHNLHAQISDLRGALGSDRHLVRTVSGRGYQFTGEIRSIPPTPAERVGGMEITAPSKLASVLPPTNLPEPTSELIGRDDDLAEVMRMVAAHRLVTLTGAGGIGKTRLALAAGLRLRPQFADGAWVAELSPVGDPDLVRATVIATLGRELAGGEASVQRTAQALAGRPLLLVLDTCEHVITVVAALVEAILQAGSGVHIIATSREPLRAEGEQIYPVPPLAVPAAKGDDPWRYAALRLFLARARGSGARVWEDPRITEAAATICRRLDGIPLAIELAASRAVALSIDELAAGLDDRFRLLTAGRRTALPRHQTLRATLDWSYELLPEPERVLLHRLSVFAGPFSREAADAVATGPELASEVLDSLFGLVAKSLVVAEVAGFTTRYRLLDTTRAYAREKLVQSGEFDAVARRHAERYQDIFAGTEAEAAIRPTDEWLADYVPRMDNLRAALDWAFSPDGDATIGVALTAAAVPLWMHLSLMEECRGRVERALAAITAGAGGDARWEMQLHAALAQSLMYTRGAVSEVGKVWTKTFEIAESLGDAEYQLRSLWGLWAFRISGGRRRAALSLAQRFFTLATKRSEPNDRLIGERMIGMSHYYLGDLLSARRHIERVLAHYVAPAQKSQIVRFQIDQWVGTRVRLARILWLQGLPEQGMRTAESSVADARATNHAISLGHALAVAACPIALSIGDLAAAEHYVEMLLDHSTRHELARWRAWGLSYQGVLAIQRDDLSIGLRLLRVAFAEPGAAGSAQFFTFLMAEALGRAGQTADGLATIEEAIVRSERTEERWVFAELLRIKGEPGAAATAEDHFRQALDWAHRQGALSWELRAATSLARLWRDQHRVKEARALLRSVYGRFTEGFATADLQAAKSLLEELA
jgi:predicted ATPase/DNA-binding winged helix-turn-helix (wHTH) protein